MDFLTLVVLTVLLIGGAWGSILISGLLKRRNASLEAGPGDLRFDALQDDHRLLESRIERLEEEVDFLRELQKPKAPTELSSGDQSESAALD